PAAAGVPCARSRSYRCGEAERRRRGRLRRHAHLPGELNRVSPAPGAEAPRRHRSEEHTSELQSRFDLVCRLLLEKKKNSRRYISTNRQVIIVCAAIDFS